MSERGHVGEGGGGGGRRWVAGEGDEFCTLGVKRSRERRGQSEVDGSKFSSNFDGRHEQNVTQFGGTPGRSRSSGWSGTRQARPSKFLKTRSFRSQFLRVSPVLRAPL